MASQENPRSTTYALTWECPVRLRHSGNEDNAPRGLRVALGRRRCGGKLRSWSEVRGYPCCAPAAARSMTASWCRDGSTSQCNAKRTIRSSAGGARLPAQRARQPIDRRLPRTHPVPCRPSTGTGTCSPRAGEGDTDNATGAGRVKADLTTGRAAALTWIVNTSSASSTPTTARDRQRRRVVVAHSRSAFDLRLSRYLSWSAATEAAGSSRTESHSDPTVSKAPLRRRWLMLSPRSSGRPLPVTMSVRAARLNERPEVPLVMGRRPTWPTTAPSAPNQPDALASPV